MLSESAFISVEQADYSKIRLQWRKILYSDVSLANKITFVELERSSVEITLTSFAQHLVKIYFHHFYFTFSTDCQSCTHSSYRKRCCCCLFILWLEFWPIISIFTHDTERATVNQIFRLKVISFKSCCLDTDSHSAATSKIELCQKNRKWNNAVQYNHMICIVPKR